MKNFFIIGVLVVALLIGENWWSMSMSQADPNIISRNGIHWHPELSIFVEGEEFEISERIGLLGTHSPVHTHEDLPVIHLEFSGLVRKDDIRLGKFFAVWGREFGEFGQNVKMTVNGAENTELENYVMQNGDKIELHYSN